LEERSGYSDLPGSWTAQVSSLSRGRRFFFFYENYLAGPGSYPAFYSIGSFSRC